MQVSDLLVQYQNNLAAGSEISTGTKGIEQLVEAVKQLQPGNIFEGTVNSIKGTQVILGLSSGQNITARLDVGLPLQKGQSVFFQVKSNDGTQIRIKPVSLGGNLGNPTLMQALDAANLAVNEKNLNMVNAMMKQQMPIDAKSLQDMSRQILQLQEADPATVVEMSKLEIPLTDVNVVQFENYKTDQREVLTQMQQLVDTLPQMFADERITLADSIQCNRQWIGFFVNGQERMSEQMTSASDVTSQSESAMQAQEVEIGAESAQQAHSQSLQILSEKAAVLTQELQPMDTYAQGTIGNTLPPQEFASLQKQLAAFPAFLQSHPQYFTENGQMRPAVDVNAFLSSLASYFSEHAGEVTREKFVSVISDKGYKKLLSQMMTQQWTMEPKELNTPHSVKHLYQRMEQQLLQLEQMVDKFPKAGETVQKAAGMLSQNIEFMNQLNQVYAYVQVPIRLRGQNVNSELFVYRNAAGQKGEEDELSAFLHFQMDALGGVDISVRMLHRNVETDWYLDNDQTLTLLSENMHLLEERLADKGYICHMQLNHAAKPIDFVEDLLKRDEKTGGELHRYSFDVRA